MSRCGRSIRYGRDVGGCVLSAGHRGECVGVAGADRATMVAAIQARVREIVRQVKPLPLPERLRFAADLLEAGDRAIASALARHVIEEIEKEST